MFCAAPSLQRARSFIRNDSAKFTRFLYSMALKRWSAKSYVLGGLFVSNEFAVAPEIIMTAFT